MSDVLTLLLIDDHSLLRCGLAELLNTEPDFRVLATAACGVEGIEMAARLQPMMVLLDLHMPGMSGLQTQACLSASSLTVRSSYLPPLIRRSICWPRSAAVPMAMYSRRPNRNN